MARFALIIFITIFVVLALVTTSTSATANLANGVAFATTSTALGSQQGITVFMAQVAIVAGIGVSFGMANFLALRGAAKQRQSISPLSQPGIRRSFGQEQVVCQIQAPACHPFTCSLSELHRLKKTKLPFSRIGTGCHE